MAGAALIATLTLTHTRVCVCRCLLVERRGWVGTNTHLKQEDESLLYSDKRDELRDNPRYTELSANVQAV